MLLPTASVHIGPAPLASGTACPLEPALFPKVYTASANGVFLRQPAPNKTLVRQTNQKPAALPRAPTPANHASTSESHTIPESNLRLSPIQHPTLSNATSSGTDTASRRPQVSNLPQCLANEEISLPYPIAPSLQLHGRSEIAASPYYPVTQESASTKAVPTPPPYSTSGQSHAASSFTKPVLLQNTFLTLPCFSRLLAPNL